MKWEFLGIQELPEFHTPGKGYTYKVSQWRTPVPGGWLVMSVNSKSNDPQPQTTFYPDPSHVWTATTPPEADYLLRPAAAGALPAASNELLRASEGDNELRQLER